MTAATFRAMATRLQGVVEASHMDHPDFRVGGKIFATLGPGEIWGGVKLTPEQQSDFMHDSPGVFEPAAGAWGRKGYTLIKLRHAKTPLVRQALLAAWINVAPKPPARARNTGRPSKLKKGA